MTAVPDGQSIAYYDDAYGRDKARWRTMAAGHGAWADREPLKAPGRDILQLVGIGRPWSSNAGLKRSRASISGQSALSTTGVAARADDPAVADPAGFDRSETIADLTVGGPVRSSGNRRE